MKQHEVTVPQIGLIAGTRAMLGAGIALLLSEKLTAEQRRGIGWTLVAVGALTTIALVLQWFSGDEGSRRGPLVRADERRTAAPGPESARGGSNTGAPQRVVSRAGR